MPVSGLEAAGIYAVRIGYTQYKRRHAPDSLPTAVNAVPLEKVFDYNDTVEVEKCRSGSASSASSAASSTRASSTSSIEKTIVTPNKIDEQETYVEPYQTEDIPPPVYAEKELELKDSDIENDRISTVSTSSRLIAVYPQYLTKQRTTITIRENDFSKRSGCFSVRVHENLTNLDLEHTSSKKAKDEAGNVIENAPLLPTGLEESGKEIFLVHRERPSFSHRQIITDAHTNEEVLTVRHDVGQTPKSFRFDDTAQTKVLDLQGNFFVPTQGLRATALFRNNAGVDQGDVKLFMQGAWRNRKAVIRDTESGEVLATMKSEVGNARSWVGRRTYVVCVAAGVDLAVVTGMIVALDDRA